MDSVSGRWGKGTVKVGSGMVGEELRDWGVKQDRRTPAYTTEWADMPTAKA
jgi:DNA polymerase V